MSGDLVALLICGLTALIMGAFAVVAINQRDDADDTLRAVRYFAFHPSDVDPQARLELIQTALREGRR